MAIDGMTPVPTVKGWLLASDVREGDYVFGEDGMPQRVALVQLYTPTQMWAVRFDDGLGIMGDGKLILPVLNRKARKMIARLDHYKKTDRPYPRKRRAVDTPLEVLVASDLKVPGSNMSQYTVNCTKPIVYREEPHPVPPFVAGMWAAGRKTINVPDKYKDYVEAKLAEYGYELKRAPAGNYVIKPDVQKGLLARYTPMPNSLPLDYYFGTPEQRIELLRGMLVVRSTAYDPETRGFYYESAYRKFPRMLQSVVESLGVKTKMYKHKSFTPYTLQFKCALQLLPDQQKASRLTQYTARYVREILPVRPALSAYIETENKTTFAVGEGYIQCR